MELWKYVRLPLLLRDVGAYCKKIVVSILWLRNSRLGGKPEIAIHLFSQRFRISLQSKPVSLFNILTITEILHRNCKQTVFTNKTKVFCLKCTGITRSCGSSYHSHPNDAELDVPYFWIPLTCSYTRCITYSHTDRFTMQSQRFSLCYRASHKPKSVCCKLLWNYC